MGFGNLLVTVFLSYFTLHIISMLLFKKKRIGVQTTNKKLDELRTIPVKTLEEQKNFIDIKYPKRRGKFKWRWNIIPKILLRIGAFIGIILVYRWLLAGFNIRIWQAILFIIIFPFFLNLVLERYGIQKSDLSVFLR